MNNYSGSGRVYLPPTPPEQIPLPPPPPDEAIPFDIMGGYYG